MIGEYPVFLGKHQLGTVAVKRAGLYYQFVCRCKLPGNVLYRLRISCDDTQENLGVLVPEGDRFVLNTKLPVKKFREGSPEFWIFSNSEGSGEKVIPVYPDEPFAYISRLKDMYLVRKNGYLGLAVK